MYVSYAIAENQVFPEMTEVTLVALRFAENINIQTLDNSVLQYKK